MTNNFLCSSRLKVLVALFCSIAMFNIGSAGSYLPTLTSIDAQYETAIEVSKKFQKDELSKEEANEILIAAFSDYSHSDGKMATLSQFLKKTTGLENFTINPASEQRGWSGSETYWIQTEKSREAQFFLKIFPYDSRDYLPEIFGLAFMSEVKELGSPKICVCGQCFINGNRCYLVLETPVSGISIQQYFGLVAQHPIGSKERSQAFAELCEATQACGMGLAAFHNYIPAKRFPFPKEAEERMRLDLSEAINELISQPEKGIEVEQLQAYAEDLLQKIKAYEHLIGVAYEDIKTIHTFYDPLSGKFSLVNPHRLHLSFNRDGSTKGLLIRDICKYSLSLILNRYEYFLDENQSVCRQELLTVEEVGFLKNVFESSYEQGGGILPNATEKEYIALQHDLFFIKNRHRQFPEPELTRVKDLISISLENLKFHLNKNLL